MTGPKEKWMKKKTVVTKITHFRRQAAGGHYENRIHVHVYTKFYCRLSFQGSFWTKGWGSLKSWPLCYWLLARAIYSMDQFFFSCWTYVLFDIFSLFFRNATEWVKNPFLGMLGKKSIFPIGHYFGALEDSSTTECTVHALMNNVNVLTCWRIRFYLTDIDTQTMFRSSSDTEPQRLTWILYHGKRVLGCRGVIRQTINCVFSGKKKIT